MSVKGVAEIFFSGLSTDTKPTGVANGSRFTEEDTGDIYRMANGVWNLESKATLTRGGTVYASGGLTAAVNVVIWSVPYACTLIAVKGYRISGTGATINTRRSGLSTNLATDLSLTTANTWLDGGAVQNTAYVLGDTLEMMITSVTGSPTQIAVQANFTRP